MFTELKAKATKYLQRLDLSHMVKHLQKHFGLDEIVGLIKTHDESQKQLFLGRQSMGNVGEDRHYGVINHAHSTAVQSKSRGVKDHDWLSPKMV